MAAARTTEEKFQELTQRPIPALILKMAAPTIVSMMITAVYNMADTFFVGRIGTSATGAVGVVFSLMAVIQAVGFTFGNGAGNYISRLLGRQETEQAARTAATGFFSVLILGGVLAALGLVFLDPLVRMLGATDTILPYARAYAGYILIGMPYMAASFTLNNLLRFQGNSIYAMVGIAAGAVLNIALDPLFIFVFGMGVGGAALATIISQLVSFCILLYNCGLGGSLRIRWRNFTPTWAMYHEILRGGLPSFYRQGLASAATICLNLAVRPYGDGAIAAMSIVSRVSMFANSAMLGFGQGFQPVCGFNYGAGKYRRVREAFWFCVRVSFVVLLVFAAAGAAFAPQIIAVFRAEDLQVIQIGSRALRLQALTLPLMSWIIICNMMLQTIGRSNKASLLAVARQGLFFLPAVWVLPAMLGIFGVQCSQPIADICTFLLALPLGAVTLRELREDQPAEAGR